MKKIVLAILCATITISMAACVPGIKKGTIGETYTSYNEVEFTLTSVSFAEVIDGWGGSNENFWKPIDENNCNIGKDKRWQTVEAYALEHGLKPKDDNDRVVCISYTAKNNSKNDVIVDSIGKLDYDNGYEYSEGYLAFRFSDTAVWKENNSGMSIEKLSDKTYEFRAYMVVPKEVVESDKPLTYTLFNRKYTIR